MEKILKFINRFILILSNFLRKLNKLILTHHKKNMVILNKFLKNHKSIKNEFDPLIKEKSTKNTELLCKLNNLHKMDSNLSNEIKDLNFKNEQMHKKIKILGDLIINK